jgi:hypothetical protein
MQLKGEFMEEFELQHCSQARLALLNAVHAGRE